MKKILIVVDMQNDFIDGAIGTKEAQEIIDNVVAKIKNYHANNNDVFYTIDSHNSTYMQTREGKYLPVPHCIIGTNGVKLTPKVRELCQDESKVFYKNTFGTVELSQTLQRLVTDSKNTQIEIVGVATDICVITNALLIKTFLPELDVIVDSKCCAGVTPQKHENALDIMRSNQIIVL